MKHTGVAGLVICIASMASGCKTPTTAQLIRQGVAHFQVGRLDRAKTDLRQALDRRPSHPEALFYMARIYHAEKFYEQAIYYYQCCLDADPSYVPARKHLAEAIEQAGLAGPRLRFLSVPPGD